MRCWPNKYLIAALSLVLLNTGCASIEPWVKPYERDKLADPIMAFNRNPLATSHLNHVQDSREAAHGATGAGGGGCGCN